MTSLIGFFQRFMFLLVFPISVMNFLGGTIALVWLLFLGEWRLVLLGFMYLIIGPFAVGFAMLPGLVFAAPAHSFLESGKKILAGLFILMSTFYTVSILSIWCIWILIEFSKYAGDNLVIPSLLWSYGVAMGTLQYLATKDEASGNQGTHTSVFFAQVAYVLTLLMIVFIGASLTDVIFLFISVMFLGFVFQWGIIFLDNKNYIEHD